MHILIEMLEDAGLYSLHLGEAYADDEEFADSVYAPYGYAGSGDDDVDDHR